MSTRDSVTKTMNKFSEVQNKQTKGISLINMDDIPWASYQDQFIVKILNSKDPLKDIADLKKEMLQASSSKLQASSA